VFKSGFVTSYDLTNQNLGHLGAELVLDYLRDAIFITQPLLLPQKFKCSLAAISKLCTHSYILREKSFSKENIFSISTCCEVV